MNRNSVSERYTKTATSPRIIRGPDGRPLSLSDLPGSEAGRWVASKKAVVVSAVLGGLLTIDEACHRYRLTIDEFLQWQKALDSKGLKGLQISQIQKSKLLEDPIT